MAEEYMHINVEIVMDECGILYAVLPDGTKRKICADVPGNLYYGQIRILDEVKKGER